MIAKIKELWSGTVLDLGDGDIEFLDHSVESSSLDIEKLDDRPLAESI